MTYRVTHHVFSNCIFYEFFCMIILFFIQLTGLIFAF